MLAAGQPTEGRGSGRKDMEGSRHCTISTTSSHPLQKHAQVVTHHSYPAMSLEAFPTQPPQHSTWHHLQKIKHRTHQVPTLSYCYYPISCAMLPQTITRLLEQMGATTIHSSQPGDSIQPPGMVSLTSQSNRMKADMVALKESPLNTPFYTPSPVKTRGPPSKLRKSA